MIPFGKARATFERVVHAPSISVHIQGFVHTYVRGNEVGRYECGPALTWVEGFSCKGFHKACEFDPRLVLKSINNVRFMEQVGCSLHSLLYSSVAVVCHGVACDLWLDVLLPFEPSLNRLYSGPGCRKSSGHLRYPSARVSGSRHGPTLPCDLASLGPSSGLKTSGSELK